MSISLDFALNFHLTLSLRKSMSISLDFALNFFRDPKGTTPKKI